jgi:hypothetical protein
MQKSTTFTTIFRVKKSATFTTILRVKKCHFHYDMQKMLFARIPIKNLFCNTCTPSFESEKYL